MKNRRMGCVVRQGDPKEDCRVSAPTVVHRVTQVDNSRRQGRKGVEMLDEGSAGCATPRGK
jgi:hypothetical protein